MKRPPKEPYHFYNETYLHNFYFIPGWSRQRTYEFFGVDPEDGQGMTFTCPNGIVIWLKDFSVKNIDYLLHESVHAANVLLDYKGVAITYKNDEAQAYLIQWVFKNCYSKFGKK